MRDRESDEGRLDRALRDLVGGEAPADLRRRVMARISLVSQRSRLVTRFAWAAGLAGLVLVVVFLARPDRETRVPRQVVGTMPSAPETAPTRPQEPAASPVATTAIGSRSGSWSAKPPESQPFVDALPTPEPLDTAPLRHEKLVVPRLVLSGLEVTGLDIEPLEPS
jgi:hypothetical protein